VAVSKAVADNMRRYGLDPEECRARAERQAATLRRMAAEGEISLGQRDSSGNSIQALINALDRAAAR